MPLGVIVSLHLFFAYNTQPMRCPTAVSVFGFGVLSAVLIATAKSENAPAAPASNAGDASAQRAAPRKGAALDSTAITEATEAGRQIAAPTADRPVYVVIHSGGRHDFGSAISEKSAPTTVALDQQMQGSLARAHYLPADAGHQPSLLIVYNWGVHGVSSENFDDPGYRNLLDRASLVGGGGFASELNKVLQQAQIAADATPTGRWGAQMPGMRPVNAASSFQAANPFERFRNRDQKTEDLLVQISNDCYYVVISAFEYSTVGKGKSRLFWRTKLTAAAPGISMADAIPSLIASGGRYFGQSMTEAEFFSSR
jgi:hypothetical protein